MRILVLGIQCLLFQNLKNINHRGYVKFCECGQWDNTVRRKCEYGVFQITNAKNLVKSRVEDEWFVKNFWHEWFGKPHTHISDLTVLTLLKTTNMHKMRKNLWNCSKVLSKTHIHTLHFTKCWVKLMYTLYILQSVE